MHNVNLPISFYVFGTVLVMLLVAMIINMMFLLRQKARNHQLFLEQERAEAQNKMLHIRMEVKEQTLEQIARELHDNIGQELSTVKLILQNLDHRPKSLEETRKVVRDSVHILEKLYTDMRLVSHSLKGYNLHDIGLVPAIEKELFFLKEYAGVETTLIHPQGEIPEMDENAHLVLFRIVQECLQNIVKHAHASRMSLAIKVMEAPKSIQINITDNGVGLDTAQTPKGIGLSNIEQRIRMLNGTFTIRSRPGEGTGISIEIPISLNKEK